MKLHLNYSFENHNFIKIPSEYYVFVFFVLFLLFLIIIAIIVGKGKRKMKSTTSNKVYTRSIKIDLKNSTFTYLNLREPNNLKTKPLSDFYSTFAMLDHESVRNWIESLIVPNEKKEKFFERYVYEKRRRDYIFATYKHIKSNYSDQTVYLNVTIYPCIKKLGVVKMTSNEFVNIPDLSKYLDITKKKKKKKKDTCIFVVNLFNKSNLISKDYEDDMHKYTLKLLNRYLSLKDSKNFLYSTYDNSTICLIAQKNTNEQSLENYLNLLLDNAYTYFSLHNLHELYDYRIGIYRQSETEDDLLLNKVKKAYQAAIYAKESSSKAKHAIYSSEIFENEVYSESLLKESLDMIKNNMFYTYYKPFIQIASSTVNTKAKGYICSLESKSKVVDSIAKLEEILYNADEGYNYVKFIINKCMSGYSDQNVKKSTSKNIVIKIDYPFIKNVISYFKYNKIEDFSITFIVNENYFLNSNYDILELKNDFNKIRQYGHFVGLCMENYQSNIDKDILTIFDLFVLDNNLISNFRKETRNTILIRNLIINLNKTKTPILAFGVNSWAESEILGSYGVTYIAGKIISEKSENIQEVAKNLTQKMQHKAN